MECGTMLKGDYKIFHNTNTSDEPVLPKIHKYSAADFALYEATTLEAPEGIVDVSAWYSQTQN